MAPHRESSTLSRCTQSGYDLRYLESPRCPECGLSFAENVRFCRKKQQTLWPLIYFLAVTMVFILNAVIVFAPGMRLRPPPVTEIMGGLAILGCVAYLFSLPRAIISGMSGLPRNEPIQFMIARSGAVITIISMLSHFAFMPGAFGDLPMVLLGTPNLGLIGLLVFASAARYHWNRGRRVEA